MKTHTVLFALLLGITTLPVTASNNYHYEVSVTNITRGLQFTPILVATHDKYVHAFSLGQPARPELVALAEGGDTAPLAELAMNSPNVAAIANSADVLPAPPLLFPGQTVTLEISSARTARFLSLAAMLLPTNDSFVALNRVRLPYRGSLTYTALAYDAGSESNDELCAHIPGPDCGGAGASPEDEGEGFVHISSGIHGAGDLTTADHDWRNPIARVVIRRIHNR